jgi:hypothetical protein
VTNFFPPYSYGTPPPRAQQRIGTGGYTEWKGSSADGGGGIKIGVVDNPDDAFDAYGYVAFDTGHSEQDRVGYMAAATGDDPTYGRHGYLTVTPPIFTSGDNSTAYISMREYGAETAGRAYIQTWIRDTDNTNQMVVGQTILREAGGAGVIREFSDAWYWYDNPTSGSYTALMSLNASGNLVITGSISKGSGTFDIVHPVLEGKRLRHSFIEGPQADLIYRGTVTLSTNATVINMDTEFDMAEGTWEALNCNPWSIAAASGEVLEWSFEGDTLTITGDEGTVCNWMVIGERHDPHMIATDCTDEEGRIVLEYDQPESVEHVWEY